MLSWISRIFAPSTKSLQDILVNVPDYLARLTRICSIPEEEIVLSPNIDLIIEFCLICNSALKEVKDENVEIEEETNRLLKLFISYAIRVFCNFDSVSSERIEIMKCINLICNLIKDSPPKNLINDFVIGICKVYQKSIFYQPVLEESIQCLRNSVVSSNYICSSSFFGFCINCFFSKLEYGIAMAWFVRVFITISSNIKQSLFEKEEIVNKFFSAIETNIVVSSCSGYFVQFFCQLLAIHSLTGPSIMFYFLEQNGLVILYRYLMDHKPSGIALAFSQIATIPKGVLNGAVLHFMLDRLEQHSVGSIDTLMFLSAFSNILSDNRFSINDFEKIFPVSSLLKLQYESSPETLIILIELFRIIVLKEYRALTFGLATIFQMLYHIQVDEDTLYSLFSSIDLCIKKGYITLEEFLSNGFVKFFSTIENIQVIYFLLSKVPFFTKAFISLFPSFPPDDQWVIFKGVLRSENCFEQKSVFSSLCLSFFNKNTYQHLLKPLMEAISISHSQGLLGILMSSFQNSEQSIRSFLELGGLSWIDELANCVSISDLDLIQLLTSMLQYGFIPEISEWISKLPLNHRIFQLSESEIINLALGARGITNSRVLIPALLPLVKSVDYSLTSYGDFLVSKYGFSEFIRHGFDYDNKTLCNILNRYVTVDQFEYLLMNSRNLSQYADISKDHFPLFEFSLNLTDPYILLHTYPKGITFWLKVPEQNCSNLPIFSSQVLSIRSSGTNIEFFDEKSSSLLSIKCDQWYFITIFIVNEINKNFIRISIDKSIFEHQVDFQIEALSNVCFGSKNVNGNGTWYLGSSIRLFQSWHSQVSSIQNGGPGFFRSSRIPSEVIVVTPYSSLNYRGSGANLVPYMGFPSFFKRKRHFVEAINQCFRAESQERINDIIRTLINSYIIFQGKIQCFWPHISRVLKEKSALVNSKVSTLCFDTFIIFGVSGSIEKNFLPIICDFDIWKYYPQQLYESLKKFITIDNVSCNLFSSSQFILTLQSGFNLFSNLEIKQYFLDLILTRILLSPTEDYYFHLYCFFISSDLESQIHIIESLNSILELNYSPLITNVFSYAKIVDLLLLSDIKISKYLLHLVSIINSRSPSYITFSPFFVFSLLRQLKFCDIWEFLFCLLTAEIPNHSNTLASYSKKPIVRPQIVPVFVALILASFIIVVAGFSIDDSPSSEFLKLSGFINESTKAILCHIIENPSLFSTDDVFTMMTVYFPIVLNADFLIKVHINTFSFDENNETVESQFFEKMCNLWQLPRNLVPLIEIPNDFNFFQASIAPLFTSLIPVINVFWPTFRPENVLTEGINGKVSDLKLFTIFVSLIFAAQSKNYKSLQVLLEIFEIRLSPGLYSFVSDVISDIVMNHSSTMCVESVSILFSFIARIIVTNYISNHFLRIVHSIFSQINVLLTRSELKNNESFLNNLRIIMIYIFLRVSSNDLSDIFDELHFHSSYLFNQVSLFSDFQFATSFLSLLIPSIMNLKSTKPMISSFLSSVILSNQYHTSLSENFDPNSVLMFSKFIVGIRAYIKNGQLAFIRWSSENPESFSKANSLLSLCSNSFIQKINEQFGEMKNTEVKFSQILSDFSFAIHVRQHDIQYTISASHHIMKYLIKKFLSTQMRFIEKDFYDAWVGSTLGAFYSSSSFNPNSYALSYFSWPMQSPRVIAPSHAKLPSVVYEVQIKESAFAFSQKGDDIIFKSSMFQYFQLYPSAFTPFDSPFDCLITPGIFSYTVSNDPKLLYTSFIETYMIYGNMEYSFSASFMKLNQDFPVSVFVFQHYFLILFYSTVVDSSLKLISEVQSPILYFSLVQSCNHGLFGSCSLFCGHLLLILPFESITSMLSHLWNHMPLSISLSFEKCSEFILIKDSPFPNNFLRTIQQFAQSFSSSLPDKPQQIFVYSLQDATSMWISGKISSFDYLLYLNALGGRSFSDLSQYPVFPWVISEYDSLDVARNRRDLSKPMGQLSPERAIQFDTVFFDSRESYFYGSHYSMPASVHFYLARVPPFTLCEWDLHNGWDHNQRMFSDLNGTWLSCSKTNNNDVKELIPEFFTLPEMFMNINKFNPSNGEEFVVTIPKWSKNSAHFIIYNREILEHASDLHKWIDLIFGYCQSGSGAIQTKNLFLPVCYHQPPSPNEDMDTLKLQLQNWGQCPIALFKRAHPIRSCEWPCTKNLCSDISKIAPVEYISNWPFETLSLNFILHENSYSCKVIKKLLSISFVSTITGKRCYILDDPNLVHAISIAKSINNCFIIIDLESYASLVYRIYFKGSQICELKSISTLYHDSVSKSVINGMDFLSASYYSRRIVIHDFIRSTIHRIIDTEDSVVGIGFDEIYGLLWVLTLHTLTCYTINAVFVSEKNLRISATSFEMCEADQCDWIRPVFIGFENGSIVSYHLNRETNEIEEMIKFNLFVSSVSETRIHHSKEAIYIKSKDDKVAVLYTGGKHTIEY